MNVAALSLIAAAEWLNNTQKFDGCCAALSRYKRCDCDGPRPVAACSMTVAEDALNLFRPESCGGYWFGAPNTNREERVLALLFAAQIANDQH